MSKSITFYKYQGTGNDFVITSDIYNLTTEQIFFLCDRKFGVGADGVIVMKKESTLDFDMMYYNADGSESFCGNGSRCAVRHAQYLNWITDSCSFNSNDGPHDAVLDKDVVKLKMHDVEEVKKIGKDFVTNTGSPHYLVFKDTLDIDVIESAKAIRFSDIYKKEGINVNFLQSTKTELNVRTYERGVEDETLSCGTGVTAAAIAEFEAQNLQNAEHYRSVKTLGGNLAVSFSQSKGRYSNIFLIGPATLVFSGKIYL